MPKAPTIVEAELKSVKTSQTAETVKIVKTAKREKLRIHSKQE